MWRQEVIRWSWGVGPGVEATVASSLTPPQSVVVLRQPVVVLREPMVRLVSKVLFEHSTGVGQAAAEVARLPQQEQ